MAMRGPIKGVEWNPHPGTMQTMLGVTEPFCAFH
jgi:hypothetical protein